MQKTMRMAVAVVLSLGFAVAAADAPRSAAAQKALTRHEQAMRKADQEWTRAATAAKRALIGELEQARAQAMKANLLEEANAIQGAIDAAQKELDQLMGKAEVRTFTIEARKGWQPTVEVQAGQRIVMKASGRWDAATNRNGEFAVDVFGVFGSNWYGPIARVGNQEVRIPKRAEFIAQESGVLQIQLFGGGEENDAGSVQVSVAVFPN